METINNAEIKIILSELKGGGEKKNTTTKLFTNQFFGEMWSNKLALNDFPPHDESNLNTHRRETKRPSILEDVRKLAPEL